LNPHKKRLIVIFAIGVLLIVMHNVLDNPKPNIENWWREAGWHYWFTLGYWVLVAGYILRQKCKFCGAPQIYRGASLSEWHWPTERCWKCNSKV
jgi:hypothetical protein